MSKLKELVEQVAIPLPAISCALPQAIEAREKLRNKGVELAALVVELERALFSLRSLVKGECSALLDGDRDGDGFLDIRIDEALAKVKALEESL